MIQIGLFVAQNVPQLLLSFHLILYCLCLYGRYRMVLWTMLGHDNEAILCLGHRSW